MSCTNAPQPTFAGNPVTEADEIAKLGRCVEVSRMVWGD
jgi:hypothetical protein